MAGPKVPIDLWTFGVQSATKPSRSVALSKGNIVILQRLRRNGQISRDTQLVISWRWNLALFSSFNYLWMKVINMMILLIITSITITINQKLQSYCCCFINNSFIQHQRVVAIMYYKARSDRQLTRYVSFGQDGELAGPTAVTWHDVTCLMGLRTAQRTLSSVVKTSGSIHHSISSTLPAPLDHPRLRSGCPKPPSTGSGGSREFRSAASPLFHRRIRGRLLSSSESADT